jgi:hypothetical protein
MRRILSVFAACILSAIASHAETESCKVTADPQAFVRSFAQRDHANQRTARQYTWMQRQENRTLDSNGKVKSTEVENSEYMQIYGEPFERLISKNGKSISDKERAKQDEKIDKLIHERENETPEQRQKRLDAYEKKQAQNRAFVEEVADAFTFRVLPEQSVEGRQAYVIEGTPKPGFHPRQKNSELLMKFRFQAWIDPGDCGLLKLDAQAIDTISLGGILARIGKGTRIVVEQKKLNDEVWLPSHISVKADGRIVLLKKFNVEQDIVFSDYRKFRSESRITGVQEVSASGGDTQP